MAENKFVHNQIRDSDVQQSSVHSTVSQDTSVFDSEHSVRPTVFKDASGNLEMGEKVLLLLILLLLICTILQYLSSHLCLKSVPKV